MPQARPRSRHDPLPPRECEICGGTFRPYRASCRYCSPQCRRVVNKLATRERRADNQVVHVCRACRGSFVAARSRVYCSRKCHERGRREKQWVTDRTRECRGCGTAFVIDKAARRYCEQCRPKPQTSVYRKMPGNWRTMRKRVRLEEPLCAYCRAPSQEVDHIIAVSLGGSDDRTNLQALCTNCHRVKTSKEKSRWWARRKAG